MKIAGGSGGPLRIIALRHGEETRSTVTLRGRGQRRRCTSGKLRRPALAEVLASVQVGVMRPERRTHGGPMWARHRGGRRAPAQPSIEAR